MATARRRPPDGTPSERLARELTRDSLREWAGERSFTRGADYFSQGSVTNLEEAEGVLTGTVAGTYRYHVEMSVAEDGELEYSCSCPFFRDQDAFCKHCVAVGLAYVRARESPEGVPSPPAPSRRVTMEDVRDWLRTQTGAELTALFLEMAGSDDDLRERLLLRVSARAGGEPDRVVFRRAIDRAVATGDFLEWYNVWRYARGVRRVVESLRDLLKAGHAASAAMDLIAYALDALEARYYDVDDTDGEVGGLIEDLYDLHRDACVAAKPDPEALARLLFERSQRNVDMPPPMPEDVPGFYYRALGPEGVAAYHRIRKARKPPPTSEPPVTGTRRRRRRNAGDG